MVSLLSTMCIFAQLSSGTVLPIQTETSNIHAVPNANHIFNTIHSSMRQWGSSVHHNGMSFFVATVPEGTQFYHGTHQNESVNGTEWLAFEPEHAMHFAGGGGPPPGDHHPGGPGRKRPGGGPPGGPPGKENRPFSPTSQAQKNMHDDNRVDYGPPPEFRTAGWLHTYVTSKNLRLLYFDGMSAAKSDIGTLDTQDEIIINPQRSAIPSPDSPKVPHGGAGGAMGDNCRAQQLCAIARSEWLDRIDGVLRMEAGFEVILCDFAKDLDLMSMTRTLSPSDEHQHGGPDGLSASLAIASRYHGIGGDRVTLDFENFITAYTYDLEIFRRPKEFEFGPRLRNISEADKRAIRGDVGKLIMQDQPVGVGKNWQRVADLVVDRYAARIKIMTNGESNLQAELGYALQPFIDFDARNASAEVARCVSHISPSLLKLQTSTAGAAIRETVYRICGDMVSAEGAYVEGHGDVEARGIVNELVLWLDWPVWKECTGCEWNEICYVPLWPQGTKEDYDTPNCKGRKGLENIGGGYWPWGYTRELMTEN